MRGQYAHNTHVWENTNSSIGGWEAYRDRGYQRDNVATRLDNAGYRTGLFGKFLNQYYGTSQPPGWDKWFAILHPTTSNYFNYDINNNGTTRHYGSTNSDYKTDVLSSRTQRFIGASAAQGTPFFAYVAPIAPHEPATPAPRDVHTFDGVKAPRLPSFNEADVSDKPSWIKQLPRLTADEIAELDYRHEKRVESLQAVDDLVEGVVDELENAGVLGNTYIFFTSDNGFHRGEHRIPRQKWRPYEEDIQMPLVVRGPGVAAGSTTYKLVLNTDYLPTFTDLAGEQSPHYVDGRSLRPVLNESVTSRSNAILLEAVANYSPAYYGIRTVSTNGITRRKYVEYAGGARELYNQEADAYELANKYNATAPPTGMASRLKVLKGCGADAAVTCRVAENGL